jgi:predicted transcriptional regulator
MRTTINISDGILSELRELARKRRRPFREIVEETLQKGLGAATPSSDGKPVRIATHRVGIKPAYQGLSLNQLYDQIEAEDTGKR